MISAVNRRQLLSGNKPPVPLKGRLRSISPSIMYIRIFVEKYVITQDENNS
jgi:hypothetical protein